MLDDCLPIVKANISQTCTLFAAARVRSDRISIPTNKNYIFSKQYGKNAELKITFPAGVTEEISNLKVQVIYCVDFRRIYEKTSLLRPNLTTMLRRKRPHTMYDIYIANILREYICVV